MNDKSNIYKIKANTIKVAASSTPKSIVAYAIAVMDNRTIKDFVELLAIGKDAQYVATKAAAMLTQRLEAETKGMEVLFKVTKVNTPMLNAEKKEVITVATLWQMKPQIWSASQ